MQIEALDTPKELLCLKNPPQELFYIGNKNLLKKRKIAIVGTRRPISYTKTFTANIAKALSDAGFCIVSGCAMGVDAIAHQNSYPNTIGVFANSLDIIYPKVNKTLIQNIYKNSLAISLHQKNFYPRKYSFVQRNQIVVGLSEALIITQADKNSGSLTSAKYAIEQNKPIFVLPHRINESLGTKELLEKDIAKPIYDLDTFISQLNIKIQPKKDKDEVLEFCKSNPSLQEALDRFGSKIYEYELEGKIYIKNLKVFIK